MPIDAAEHYPKRRAHVLGAQMAYVDVGEGDPIVFLHGNPTSSYLWRNVIPHVEPHGRCLAPDLIGMGDSDKLPQRGSAGPAGGQAAAAEGGGSLGELDGSEYRFVDHREYLDAFLDALGVTDRVTLVIHDWGSALGFDWARRNPQSVRGIVYMEALVRPVTWDEWPEIARPIFEALRSPAGDELVLEGNLFVERILPASMLRDPTEHEMAVYRRPYLEPGESRRPTLTWPRQIPIDGEPADVARIVGDYAEWLTQAPVPKLFVNGDPGSILVGAPREFCRSWPEQREVTVRGSHFLQEDSPDEVGRAIADWVVGLP